MGKRVALLNLAVIIMQNVLLFYTLRTNKITADLQMHTVIQKALSALYKNTSAHALYREVLSSQTRRYEIEYGEIYEYLDALEVMAAFQTDNLGKGNSDAFALYKKHIDDANLFLDRVVTRTNYSAIRRSADSSRDGKNHFSWLVIVICVEAIVISYLVVSILFYPLSSSAPQGGVKNHNSKRRYLVQIEQDSDME
ncbi:MAG: hypothetical protein LBD04_08435 [Synergistaceae bacterium]|jgi:hypothetical protein|nr:hypothetical protein [Synergistaceae bacterium]